MHEAFVEKVACEDKNCPLRFGQAECFHCKRCWFCCNQKFTICKLCGTRECDGCIDYGNAVSNGNWSNQCCICEAQADPHRAWRLKVWAGHRKMPMTETMLDESMKNGPLPSAIDRKKKFCLPTSMSSTELDEWVKECNLKVSVVWPWLSLQVYVFSWCCHLTTQSVFNSNITVVFFCNNMLFCRTVFCFARTCYFRPLQIHAEGFCCHLVHDVTIDVCNSLRRRLCDFTFVNL